MDPEKGAAAVVGAVEGLDAAQADVLRSAVRDAIAEAIEDEREECALQIEQGPLVYETAKGPEEAAESARLWFAAAIRRRAESFARQKRQDF